MIALYHDWDAFCCIKVRFCLAEKGVSFESRVIDLQRMEQLTPDYIAINPNGVVPTLVDRGRPLFESTVINEYINEAFPGPNLLPFDTHARAVARYWVKFEDDVLHPAVKGPTYQLMLSQSFARLSRAHVEQRIASAPTPQKAALLRAALDRKPPDPAALDSALRTFAVAIERMETRLGETLWFGGAEFSLADIAIAPFIDRLEELRFANLWQDKPRLRDWIGRIKARPAYRQALPTAAQRIPAPVVAA